MSMDRAALAHLRHELRTPLNHIIGYSEMLLEDAAGSAGTLESGLRNVHQQAQRLLALVNDFLGQSPAETGAVDVRALADQAREPLNAIIGAVSALEREAAQAGESSVCDDLARIASAAAALRAMVSQGVGATAGGEPDARQSSASRAAASTDAARSTILVVDDNGPNRDMLGKRLARDGHQTLLAGGGREALELLARQRIDLVLLDVMMPDLDGYEVLQRIKGDEALRDIPVLMISAVDELESVVRCIELGAEDYLPKPFDPVLLRARIGACLEKKRLRDREAEHVRQLAEWNEKLEQRVAEQVALVDRLGRLKRFFSPQLAELIVAGGADDPLKTHRREVTVIFVDLRGFTAFSETAEPEEVMGVLREYHAEMGRLILEHEGTLERFAGDGMMIFFNDPVPIPNPDERAVRMAIEMRHRMSALSSKWRKLSYDLDVGIGIARGYATIGAIGFEGRWDYGAIGPVTNLAARLCAEAKAGQILISKRVLAATGDLLEVEPAGELSLKGFSRPVPAYNVLALSSRARS